MNEIVVAVTRLPHGAGLPLPAYASPGAAGMDLLAAVEGEVVLGPGDRTLVPTGIAIALPQGYEAQVRPRSGLALKLGLALLNAPGTVDADYRGEIGVVLANFGREPYTLRRGARIAQLVVSPVTRVAWNETAELPLSGRGASGFGSTGG